MKNITIKIEGDAACGKTTVACMVKTALESVGMTVSFANVQEALMQKGLKFNFDDRLNAVKGNPVTIITETNCSDQSPKFGDAKMALISGLLKGGDA